MANSLQSNLPPFAREYPYDVKIAHTYRSYARATRRTACEQASKVDQQLVKVGSLWTAVMQQHPFGALIFGRRKGEILGLNNAVLVERYIDCPANSHDAGSGLYRNR